jgi:hypothetical protein
MSRTLYLLFLAGGPHIVRLVTPMIAASLMGRSSLAPFWAAFGCLVVIVCIIPSVSDRAPGKDNKYDQIPDNSIASEADALIGTGRTTAADEATEDIEPTLRRRKSAQKSFGYSMGQWKDEYSTIHDIFHSSAARFCLVAYFFKRVAFTSEAFMFQYAAEKFQWELRDTTWLRVASSIGAIIATLLVGPAIQSVCRKHGVSSKALDLNTVRTALIILSISFLGTWISWSGLAFVFGEHIHISLKFGSALLIRCSISDIWLWARRGSRTSPSRTVFIFE